MKFLLFLIVLMTTFIGYKAMFRSKDVNYQPKSKLAELIFSIALITVSLTLFVWIIVVGYSILEWMSEVERSKVKLPYLFPWSDVLIVITVYLSVYYIILRIHKHLSRSILRAYNKGVKEGLSTALGTQKMFLKDEDRKERERLDDQYRQDLLLNEDAIVNSDRLLGDRQWVRANLMKKSHPEYFEDYYDERG